VGTTVGDTVGATVGALLGTGVGTETVLVKVRVDVAEARALLLSVTEVLDVTAVTVVPDATAVVESDVTEAPMEMPNVVVTETEVEPTTVVPVTFATVVTGLVYVGLSVGKGVGAVGLRVNVVGLPVG